jgi:hypothetical protein
MLVIGGVRQATRRRRTYAEAGCPTPSNARGAGWLAGGRTGDRAITAARRPLVRTTGVGMTRAGETSSAGDDRQSHGSGRGRPGSGPPPPDALWSHRVPPDNGGSRLLVPRADAGSMDSPDRRPGWSSSSGTRPVIAPSATSRAKSDCGPSMSRGARPPRTPGRSVRPGSAPSRRRWTRRPRRTSWTRWPGRRHHPSADDNPGGRAGGDTSRRAAQRERAQCFWRRSPGLDALALPPGPPNVRSL